MSRHRRVFRSNARLLKMELENPTDELDTPVAAKTKLGAKQGEGDGALRFTWKNFSMSYIFQAILSIHRAGIMMEDYQFQYMMEKITSKKLTEEGVQFFKDILTKKGVIRTAGKLIIMEPKWVRSIEEITEIMTKEDEEEEEDKPIEIPRPTQLDVGLKFMGIPTSVKRSKRVSIRVSSSQNASPKSFRFNITSFNYSKELDDLKYSMDRHYKRKDNPSAVGPIRLRNPDYIAAPLVAYKTTYSNYSRAIVLRPMKGTEILVYFLDFGITKWVSRFGVRLLEERFKQLPVQALRGELAFDQDVSGLGCSRMRHHFRKLVRNCNLEAEIKTDLTYENTWNTIKTKMVMYATNRKGKRICVNEELIKYHRKHLSGKRINVRLATIHEEEEAED